MTTDLRLAAQFALGLVFLMSALPKARDPGTFAHQVVDYKVIPAPLALAAGWALVPAEVFLAFAFLTGWMIPLALLFATLCIIGFLIAVATNLHWNRDIPCGCFGTSGERVSTRTAVRLLMLLAVVLLVANLARSTDSSGPVAWELILDAAGRMNFVHTSLLGTFIVVIGTWILHTPELIALLTTRSGAESSQDRGKANS